MRTPERLSKDTNGTQWGYQRDSVGIPEGLIAHAPLLLQVHSGLSTSLVQAR